MCFFATQSLSSKKHKHKSALWILWKALQSGWALFRWEDYNIDTDQEFERTGKAQRPGETDGKQMNSTTPWESQTSTWSLNGDMNRLGLWALRSLWATEFCLCSEAERRLSESPTSIGFKSLHSTSLLHTDVSQTLVALFTVVSPIQDWQTNIFTWTRQQT